MARKLKGKGLSGKGLKGALARQVVKEKIQKQISKASDAQKEQKLNKQKQIKSGGGKSKGQAKQNQIQIQKQHKGLIPFDYDNKLLLIGEGDFSFAVSIVQENLIQPTNLIATSYDSLDELKEKYPNIEDNLTILKDEGVKVFHNIDATNLVKDLKLIPNSKQKKSKVPHNQLFIDKANLDFIMFNFPHTGRGMKDVDRNIRDHQKLVLEYFKSCKEVFDIVNNDSKNDFAGYVAGDNKNTKEGKIILSLFEGEPYNSWNIKILARTHDYKVERSGRFDWSLFPQYHHRRTNSTRDTTKPAAERDARIYIFDKFKPKDGDSKKNDDDSDSDSD
ncbi:uncharacterized protein RJT21DRAFT_10945 [Scheffersomyces amazonensis]|uniref:uncharacterized protein n=1 Tax=Scheffersomyces amazonensis TaxID=1078765 RepID=UPI00315CCED5